MTGAGAPGGEGTIPVVAAVIESDGRWLVGLRPSGKRHGGLWEFPGGKLEPGETVLEGARRELAEELGLRVDSVGRTLFARRDPGSPFLIRFVEVSAEGTAEAREHDRIGWFTTEELEAMPLAPSDRAFVRDVLASGL